MPARTSVTSTSGAARSADASTPTPRARCISHVMTASAARRKTFVALAEAGAHMEGVEPRRAEARAFAGRADLVVREVLRRHGTQE